MSRRRTSHFRNRGGATLREGLIAYYQFEETSGNVTDSAGSNHGIIEGTGIVRGADYGLINNGIRSNGGSRVTFGNIIGGLTSFTLGIWVKGYSGALFGNWNEQSIMIRTQAGSFQVYTNADYNLGGTFNGSFDQSIWTLFLVKYDGAKIYAKYNNVLSPTTFNQSGAIKNAAYPERLFNERSTYGTGNVDELFAYNRFTTDEEDTAIYNNGNGMTL